MDPKEFYSLPVHCSPSEYERLEGEDSMKESSRLADLLLEFNFKRTLLIELGCGPGSSFEPVFDRGKFMQMVGVDYSLPMLEHFYRNYIVDLRDNISLQQLDLETGSVNIPDGRASVVFSQKTMLYIKNMEHFLFEVARLLCKDGLFLCEVTLHKEDSLSLIEVNPTKTIPFKTFVHSEKFFEAKLSSLNLIPIKSQILRQGKSSKVGDFLLVNKLYVVRKRS